MGYLKIPPKISQQKQGIYCKYKPWFQLRKSVFFAIS